MTQKKPYLDVIALEISESICKSSFGFIWNNQSLKY